TAVDHQDAHRSGWRRLRVKDTRPPRRPAGADQACRTRGNASGKRAFAPRPVVGPATGRSGARSARPPAPSSQDHARSGRYMSAMFRALATPNYRIYIAGAFVSNIGTWLQRVAQDWLVLELTHSGTAIGITT